MSICSFTALALSLRKRADLDLRPAHVHSVPKSHSFAFHVVTHDSALALCVGRQRCGRLPGTIHPLPVVYARMEGATARTTPACSVRIRRILVQTPSDGCFRRAPSLLVSPLSHSATRSVLIPRPAATARLCFGNAALRVSAFRKSFRQTSHRTRTKRFPEPSEKAPLGLGSGAPHVASRRSVPSKNRANPNRS